MAVLTSRGIIPRIFHQIRTMEDTSWIRAISGEAVPTDQQKETHGGLGNVGPMKKWEGQRKSQRLRAVTVDVENDKYEDTLLVTGDELRRDKTMQVDSNIRGLSRRAMQHWELLLTTLVENGESTACYDGQFFFDTDHAENGVSTGSNDITEAVAVPTGPTAAEMESAIWAAVTQFMTFKDDVGEPAHMSPTSFTLKIPPAFLKATLTAIGAPLLEQGRSNALVQAGNFTFNVIANPRLTWTDKFAIFVNDGRSFIRQFERIAGQEVRVTAKAEGSEFEHDYDAHEYGVMALRGTGYFDWRSAVLTTLTAA